RGGDDDRVLESKGGYGGLPSRSPMTVVHPITPTALISPFFRLVTVARDPRPVVRAQSKYSGCRSRRDGRMPYPSYDPSYSVLPNRPLDKYRSPVSGRRVTTG